MDERDVVRDLVAKLIEAVEASLDGSTAVREALDELVRSGYEPRIILLADAAPRGGESDGGRQSGRRRLGGGPACGRFRRGRCRRRRTPRRRRTFATS